MHEKFECLTSGAYPLHSGITAASSRELKEFMSGESRLSSVPCWPYPTSVSMSDPEFALVVLSQLFDEYVDNWRVHFAAGR